MGTNLGIIKTASLYRIEAYCLIDGQIAWHYEVAISPNQPSYFYEEKRDAKEYGPKYASEFKKAQEYATKKMTEAGISPGIGSIHSFWGFEKEYLNQKGIDWKPPNELDNGYID